MKGWTWLHSIWCSFDARFTIFHSKWNCKASWISSW